MNIETQIAGLAAMTTAELDAEYQRLFGRKPRYRSVPWLRKRIAFQLQVVAFGGLPNVARAAIARLTADVQLPAAAPTVPAAAPTRGPRPGTTLTRDWRGQRIVVAVTADGVEWNGTTYRSLTAAAFAITGAHWNGPLFFKQRGRTAKA